MDHPAFICAELSLPKLAVKKAIFMPPIREPQHRLFNSEAISLMPPAALNRHRCQTPCQILLTSRLPAGSAIHNLPLENNDFIHRKWLNPDLSRMLTIL
jgi:hypothetical protein